MNRHWTDDELLDRLYGLHEESGLALEHLKHCAECETRWLGLQARRAAQTGSPSQVSEVRMREQRAAIWRKIEAPERGLWWKAVPVMATALMLVVGVSLHRPDPAPAPAQVASVVSDAEFFNEVATMVNEDTPRAADPMRELFSETKAVEAQ
jgi:hypothetical protein